MRSVWSYTVDIYALSMVFYLLVFIPWSSLGRNKSPVRQVLRGSLPMLSPRVLDVPTFATRCLHVRYDARDLSSERWNYGRERLSGNFAYMASLFTPLGIFYMPQIYDMGPTALLPLRRKAC
jgi:hypothetical protein